MKFAIKADDCSYKGHVGDSLSSRYDDNGYTCWSLEDAVLFDSIQSANYGFHDTGKFSETEGARIIGVKTIEQEFTHHQHLFPVRG